MNPIRQRILQVILEKQEASSSLILDEMPDVPRASMYRHIKHLLDAGVIKVVREIPKRGSLEKVYTFSTPSERDTSNAATNQMIQTALLSLSSDFSRYLSDEKNDPVKDLLTVGSAVVLASDEELTEFISEYGKLLQKFLQNKPENNRKARKITFISSPTGE